MLDVLIRMRAEVGGIGNSAIVCTTEAGNDWPISARVGRTLPSAGSGKALYAAFEIDLSLDIESPLTTAVPQRTICRLLAPALDAARISVPAT
jgi:hypothetical protein